ncbi:protein kinase [Candidatus Uabimicrobium sp. HlEnr_7]|uniref:protein kinase domain-containing protein n=1 Tax=Candidatus Uabimicrobium helgolandensis TaxID=3095367 RepID=UPI003557AB9D
MNDDHLRIMKLLKEQGISQRLMLKTWEDCPHNCDAVSWFKNELVARGYVSEYTMEDICELSSDVELDSLDACKTFERFTLLSELGQGGMGKVYLAFDPHLNKNIALKMLIVQSSDKIKNRFIAEGQILARLHHKNIVKFYEINQHQDKFYLTMDYVDGVTLDKWVLQKNINQKILVDVFQTICFAVHEIHRLDIVHRDLKPQNIMINNLNQPIIMDFGVAKSREIKFSTLNILGTPNYMSPEQTKGKALDSSSDVFSLGIIFYELLTKRLPFVGENDYEIFTNILSQEPTSPKVISPRLKNDLETICLKCLRKEKGQRYHSALEIADDIERFKNNRVILAKPMSRLSKLNKWILRNKLTTTILLLSILIIVSLFTFYIRSVQAFSKASTASANKANLRVAQIALSRSRIAYQEKKWRNSGALAGVSLQSLLSLKGEQVEKMRNHGEELIRLNLLQHSLLWKKKGITLVGNDRFGYYKGNTFYIRYIESDDCVFTTTKLDITSENMPYFSDDGSLFAFATKNKQVQIWNVAAKKIIQIIPFPSIYRHRICFSPKNTYVALYSKNFKKAYIWSLEKKKQIREYKCTGDRNNRHVRFSDDETMFAYSDDHDIFVENLQTKNRKKLATTNSDVLSLCFVNNEKLISATIHGTVNVWRIRDGKATFAERNKGTQVALSESKEIFASIFRGNIFVWDLDLGRLLHSFKINEELHHSQLKFVNKDQQLLCCTNDDISCWRIFYSKRLFDIPQIHPLAQIDINHDSSVLSYVSPMEKVFTLWNLNTREKMLDVEHPDIVTSLYFSRKKNIAVTACKDGKIRLWKNRKLQVIHDLHLEPASVAKFHPNNDHIIVSAAGTTILIHNRLTKKTITLRGHKTSIVNLSFSHNGKMLASVGEKVMLWDLETNQLFDTLPCTLNYEYKIRLGFSANNNLLMVCNFHQVDFWDIQQRKTYLSLDFGNGNSCIFSPYYNRFIYADFRYRLVEENYGYTIQNFYYGWVRSWAMASSKQGIFAVCMSGGIKVLQLPAFPNYTVDKLPKWHKFFPLASKSFSNNSNFNLRPDVPGWFIESALKESPQLLTEILFKRKVKNDLSFE